MANGILTPCNVTCGSGIMTMNSPVAAPCNVIRGSGITCHWIRPTSPFLEFYIWFPFRPYHCSWHVILHQSAKFYPNRTTLGRKKITSCRFSRRQISAILDFRGPIMGSLKSARTTSYRSSIETIALNCLVFEKIATFFFVFWRQTNKKNRQTDEQMDSIDPLSRSRCRELPLNNTPFNKSYLLSSY